VFTNALFEMIIYPSPERHYHVQNSFWITHSS